MPALAFQIGEKVADYPKRQPFTIDDIAEEFPCAQRNTIAKILHDMERRGAVRRLAKGLYYAPLLIPGIGDAGVNQNKLARLLWIGADQSVMGYISGPAYAVALGLQTVMPNRMDIYTNMHRRYPRIALDLHINLHKPPVEVNNGNYKELRFLDAIKDDRAFDCPNPDGVMRKEIRLQKLDRTLLVDLADAHYADGVFRRVKGLAYGA